MLEGGARLGGAPPMCLLIIGGGSAARPAAVPAPVTAQPCPCRSTMMAAILLLCAGVPSHGRATPLPGVLQRSGALAPIIVYTNNPWHIHLQTFLQVFHRMDELMRSREGFTDLEALRRECEGGACAHVGRRSCSRPRSARRPCSALHAVSHARLLEKAPRESTMYFFSALSTAACRPLLRALLHPTPHPDYLPGRCRQGRGG